MQLRATRLTAISSAIRNLFAGASLDLKFVGADALDPRITFSRASNATVTNQAGTLVYAPHNLLTFSEQFDNSAWAKTRATVSANVTAAPDSTTAADKLVEDTTASATHFLVQTFSAVASTQYVFSCFVKAGERSAVTLSNTKSGMTTITSNFNLVNGTVISTTSADAKIEALSNGWYRVSQTLITDAAAGTLNSVINLNNGTTTVYTGDGTSGLFLWGAQLNVGALQPYYTTTVKNQLGYSQEFDNAAWTKSNSTVTANATVAPDGSMTADLVNDSLDASATAHAVFSANNSFVLGTAYTVSLYARQGTLPGLSLLFPATAFTSALNARFNLATGTIANLDAGLTGSITAVGNGWYRCSATATATATASGQLQIRTATSTASFYQGAGTGTIFIWGAQFSDSASLDPYSYNPVAAPTAAAYHGPRFDYNPVTLAPLGLLIEEQRTNLRTFSEAIVVGNGYSAVNCTLTSVSTSTPISGVTTATRFVLNAGANTGNSVDGTNFGSGVSLTASTRHAQSLYVKSEGAQMLRLRSNINGQVFDIPIAGPAPAPSGSVQSCSVEVLGGGWSRISWSFTTEASGVPGTRSDYWTIKTNVADGTSGVLLIGAQLEAGAFATSYIPTTTAAATRAADVATMQGANFSSWYNQNEGTVYASWISASAPSAGTQSPLAVNDGTGTNQIYMGRQAARIPRLNASAGGVGQVDVYPSGTIADSTAVATAFAYKLNDYAMVVNGGAPATDTSALVPVVTQMQLGLNAGGITSTLNGTIRRVAFYPRRLANDNLVSITK